MQPFERWFSSLHFRYRSYLVCIPLRYDVNSTSLRQHFNFKALLCTFYSSSKLYLWSKFSSLDWIFSLLGGRYQFDFILSFVRYRMKRIVYSFDFERLDFGPLKVFLFKWMRSCLLQRLICSNVYFWNRSDIFWPTKLTMHWFQRNIFVYDDPRIIYFLY